MNKQLTTTKKNNILPAAPEIIYYPYTHKDDRFETTGSGHFHWSIIAFSNFDSEGLMKDSMTIEVEAINEQEAISRAMDIVIRNNYRVSSVREFCTLDEIFKK